MPCYTDASEVTVFEFPGLTSSEVYDESQTLDGINDGDVLVDGEGRVAVLVKAWPVYIGGGPDSGAFHALGPYVTWDNVDGEDYTPSFARARRVLRHG